MSKRFTSGLVAAIVAVSMSIPAIGLANKGGVPHSTKACPTHKHSGKHKGASKGHKKGATKGKKCGWGGTGQTGTTGQTSTTGSTTGNGKGKGKDNGATHGLKRGHRS
jgi:hypothetical protein